MGLLVGVGTTRPAYAYDYYYGVEWDVTVSNPKLTRVGKMELHQSLPVQSLMRRCVLKDNGAVNYYLHANDSTKRGNSADADLTGADGQVMVEIPDMYVRFEMDGNKRRCLMSIQPLPGFIKWPKDYVSAYEATVERATGKLASVVNATAGYRGGGNESGLDESGGTQLGRPATCISLPAFRECARKRGSVEWNCNTYQIQRKLYWLFAVEYANFNSQDVFNEALTESGYHQGGLGAGVTNLADSLWMKFNGYRPVIPCGYTNSLGNRTGNIGFAMPAEYGALATVQVPSYRGIENPFGHIWKWTDGCKCLIQPDTGGGFSEFYVCDTPANFTSTGVANYEFRGNLPRIGGYVKELVLGEYGEIMPLAVGAGSTTCFCDYFFISNVLSAIVERGVLFGGIAASWAFSGLVCAYTLSACTDATTMTGSRLCFIPQTAGA